MILLRPDCLVFKTTTGESVPCSAHQITLELIGESAEWLDQELIENAAAAVLHYFRVEKQQESVSVAEFSQALEHALRRLGLNVKSLDCPSLQEPAPRLVDTNLQQLAEESGSAAELFFFPRLRHELRRQLDGSPVVLRFRGLRGCVKMLVGAKRWSNHCQTLNDRIVDYLRSCLRVEQAASGCALVVV